MSYETTALTRAAEHEALTDIAQRWERAKKRVEAANDETVGAANELRAIGLDFQGISQHEQMKISCFERVKAELPEDLTYEKAQLCIRLANASEGEFKTYQDLKAAQLVFQIGGFLELPHRTEQQHADPTPPAVFVFQVLSSVKEKFEKRFVDVETWSDQARKLAHREIAKHELWIDDLKGRLGIEEEKQEGRAA